MALFDLWCDNTKEKDERKEYWCLVEKVGGRDAIRASLSQTVRSHYDRLDRIAEDVARLSYEGAAEILRAQLPQTAKGRSGDLGEILATELVEEEIGLRVPVRRLRYKDGRNMAMRGDDFIGAGYGAGDDGELWLLKGEAKSNKMSGKSHRHGARKVLNRDGGRCTPNSLLFVANRLLESDDADDVALGRAIRDEVGLKALRADRINHMLFTMSGNAPPAALKEDLEAASTNRDHYRREPPHRGSPGLHQGNVRRGGRPWRRLTNCTTFLTAATQDGILRRLLYRGCGMVADAERWRLPANAPPLGATIETDLAEHGFALLRAAMALRSREAGRRRLTSKAFERAANAFEALVRNGDPEAADRGFRRTIAAAAYHLAGYSAVAYSLFNEAIGDLNAAPGETAVDAAHPARPRPPSSLRSRLAERRRSWR